MNFCRWREICECDSSGFLIRGIRVYLLNVTMAAKTDIGGLVNFRGVMV